jgi:thioredoxin reductase (NADPH)
MEKVYDLIIIGGGPGGIGSAIEAKFLGLEKILLIEKTENHSDTIRKFYKDKKRVDKDWKGQTVELEGNIDFVDGTKESTLDYFDHLLEDDLIDTCFSCEVVGVVKRDDIFTVTTNSDEFFSKNVIVAIGRMGKPNKPSYKIPASLRSKVGFNLDKCSTGEKVLVVGGGDSAVEYACDLSETNNVVLNYRKSELTRPNPTNQKMLKTYVENGNVFLKLGIDIESVTEEEGKISVNFVDGSSEFYDKVVYAIGGTTPKDFLKSCGITLNKKDEAIFDENYESETKGLYIEGDIAFASGGSIAIALNHGYRIVTHILGKK